VANCRVSTNTKTTAIRKHKDKTNKGNKNDQLRLFIFKREFLKISVDLRTALAAETHLAEGQWLEEQLNMVKLRMFRAAINQIIIIIIISSPMK
jgi:hypothetical protein